MKSCYSVKEFKKKLEQFQDTDRIYLRVYNNESQLYIKYGDKRSKEKVLMEDKRITWDDVL